MAPDATQIMFNKWQNSAVYARFLRCDAVQPEPPKLAAGGVGVGGSNPLVPTNKSMALPIQPAADHSTSQSAQYYNIMIGH